MDKKGYIYTVVSLMFALIMLALASLYYESYQNSANLEPASIRTDELHYFIESSKEDVARAMSISGRRGAVYLTDYVIESNRSLTDSQKTLNELILNGTITNGTQKVNVSGMRNHTLSDWLAGIKEAGKQQNFVVNASFSKFDIYAFDELHFLEVLTIDYNVSDKAKSCKYEGRGINIYSLISIEGIEDVYYPLHTGNRIDRYFEESGSTQTTQLIALGTQGNGSGGGIVFDISNATSPDNNITYYNSTHPDLVNYTVFVMNLSQSNYTALSSGSKAVLNMSGGLINYQSISVNRTGFPYVSGVPWTDFSTASEVVLRNGVRSEIIKLQINSDIEGGMYHPSAQGPTFFDRLEGNNNATQKYTNQSKYIRGLLNLDTGIDIGLESFVNVSEFASNGLYRLSILKNFTNQSSVDYLYFRNSTGNWICGTPVWFRADQNTTLKYNLTEFEYDPSLVAWFNFNEGSGDIIYDHSRKGNNLARLGMIWADGKTLTGIQSNGTSNYLTARSPICMPGGNNVTVTAWIKPSSSQSDPTHNSVVSWGPRIGTGTSFSLGIQSNGRPSVTTWGNDYTPASPAVNFNQWNFIAAVLSSQSIKLYVNNQSVTGSMPLPVQIQYGALNIDSANDPPGRGLSGVIDEVKIWNRALSDQEILEEYQRVG